MNSPDPTVFLDTRAALALDGALVKPDTDTAQFEGLVRENQTSLFRVAYRLTGDRDEAEDLVQEALIEAFEAFPRFRAGTHFDRWVFRIMRNTFLDGRRRKAKAKFDSLDAAADGGSSGRRELGISPFSADTEIMARTLDGPIQDALDGLPAEFKMVVVLADIEGLSYDEVADVLGRPIGTVRSRLHRARLILKEKLKAYVRS